LVPTGQRKQRLHDLEITFGSRDSRDGRVSGKAIERRIGCSRIEVFACQQTVISI
jgi:hypothetical protein